MKVFRVKRILYSLKNYDKKRGNKNWGIEDENRIPKGSIMHPKINNPKILDYSKYNAVWEDPDNPGTMIHNFKLNELFDNNFLSDKIWIDKDPILSKRLEIFLDDLRNGRFVFDDNDTEIIKKYNDKSDPLYYEWDTCTHYLQDFVHRHKNKSLVYAKDIDLKNRLSYRVDIPELINGVWTCNIVVSNCKDHKYMNQVYGRESYRRFSEEDLYTQRDNILNASSTPPNP